MQKLGYPEGSLLAPGGCFDDDQTPVSDETTPAEQFRNYLASSTSVSASLALASILVLAQIV